ncbi:MAG: formate dehydrogenase, partial [Bacteroidetes bacterium]
LPMGLASERHDLNSYETHGAVWIAFRQPVLREEARREGKEVTFTYETNPGEVWEEDEFWIELSWRIDPDGSLGIRDHFKSPYRKDEKINIDEYYQYIFEHTEGLPEKAAEHGMTPLDYMKKFGAFEVESHAYEKNLKKVPVDEMIGAEVDPKSRTIYKNGKSIGLEVDGESYVGFPTPSRKQEFFSQTMIDWKWPEYAIPTYIKSHIHEDNMDRSKGDFPLVPTFRLPVLIHSRSANSKWLNEIANRNPVWMHTSDAKKLDIRNDDLVRVNTDIGYFIDKVWVTEGMKPGIVACSHHIGRWRRPQDTVNNRWGMNTVKIENSGDGKWKMSTIKGIQPSESSDPDTSRIFWSDGGVHQNITFPVHPDPISGMQCWHQKVRIEKARPEDTYGDVSVDTNKSFEVYKEWLSWTRPAPGPDGERRPLWFPRALKPDISAYYMNKKEDK